MMSDDKIAQKTPPGEFVARFIEHLRDDDMRLKVENHISAHNYGDEAKRAILWVLEGRATAYFVLADKIEELKAQNAALQEDNMELLNRARAAENLKKV